MRIVRFNTKVNIKLLAVLLLGIGLFGVGAAGLWQRYHATHTKAAVPVASVVVTDSTPTPSESKPDEKAAYNVPADQPKKITLTSITASGYVQKVVLDKLGAIGAPNNVYFAGWYNQSVLPGQKGLSIIDGHVSGKYSDGIFKNLGRVAAGDQIKIEFGDGSFKAFSVVKKVQLPEADAGTLLLQKQTDIVAQLNLITCAGTFNKTTGHYDDRLLVITKAI
jgi:LPXTG-site transpeptidase (sortase) family protein